MKKYIWAFLITIPILLLVWNIDDSAEEPTITYSDTVEENRGDLASTMQETDVREGIRPEEIGDMDEESSNEELLTQIIIEHLQNNDFSGITFRESEKALCYYMGTARDFPNMYAFAVCKEALNGDIVNEKNIYIEKETGHVYIKDNGTLVQSDVDVPKGMHLPDVTRNSVWNWEPELIYSEDGTSFHFDYGENGEKVLNQMFDFTKREEVLGDWGVIYYGECTYFYRRYHEVHLVEEHDTHVITLKRYYIDALSGNVYEEPYESFIGGVSDIALHFVGKIEIGEEKIAETDQDKLENVSDIPNHATPFREFEEIEKNHIILEYDICSEPKYDYENIPLGENLSTEIEEVKETLGEVTASRTTIDYHVFDFNDDGLEDYLICIDGPTHSGSGGNHVEIDVQEEDGTFRKVLDIVLRIHGDDSDGHEALTVLDEKTDGFYAIVTPFYNHILRYDKETGWYEFHDGE